MRVLGIDPGYAIVGYGVVDCASGRFSPVDYGAVTTPAGMDFNRRLELIFRGLCEVIDKTKPEAMAIEKLYFNTNTTTAIEVAEARGVILLSARLAGIPIFEYTPLQVKQAVTGYGRAAKEQIQEMVKMLLRLKAVPKPDDTADALAIALCHGQTAGNLLNRYR